MLSSHGQEIPKISDRLKALGSAPVEAPDLPSVCDTDIDGKLDIRYHNLVSPKNKYCGLNIKTTDIKNGKSNI